jgi:hypothetical protein
VSVVRANAGGAKGVSTVKTHFVSFFELDGNHPNLAVHGSLMEAKAALRRALNNNPHPDRVVEACIFKCIEDGRSDPILP